MLLNLFLSRLRLYICGYIRFLKFIFIRIFCVIRYSLCIAEVNYFDVVIRVNHDISRFQIPVHHIFLLHVFHKVYQLSHQYFYKVLAGAALALFYKVVKSTVFSVFENKVKVLLILF